VNVVVEVDAFLQARKLVHMAVIEDWSVIFFSFVWVENVEFTFRDRYNLRAKLCGAELASTIISRAVTITSARKHTTTVTSCLDGSYSTTIPLCVFCQSYNRSSWIFSISRRNEMATKNLASPPYIQLARRAHPCHVVQGI
jgi:hypothetical protein